VKYSFAAALLTGLSITASAAAIHPDSYSMFNGGLSDIPFGDIFLVDEIYNGTGDPAINYDLLENGTGDLTDGVVSNVSWNVGHRPWVGWSDEFDTRGINPAINFLFGTTISFNTIRIHVDDTDGLMNVEVPGSVEVSDGLTNLIFNLPTGGSGPQWFDLNVSGLRGDFVILTLNQQSGFHWVFLDEVEFDGVADVPEPATFMFVGVALAGAGLLRRRGSRS
jgi:hypothetical protein